MCIEGCISIENCRTCNFRSIRFFGIPTVELVAAPRRGRWEAITQCRILFDGFARCVAASAVGIKSNRHGLDPMRVQGFAVRGICGGELVIFTYLAAIRCSVIPAIEDIAAAGGVGNSVGETVLRRFQIVILTADGTVAGFIRPTPIVVIEGNGDIIAFPRGIIGICCALRAFQVLYGCTRSLSACGAGTCSPAVECIPRAGVGTRRQRHLSVVSCGNAVYGSSIVITVPFVKGNGIRNGCPLGGVGNVGGNDCPRRQLSFAVPPAAKGVPGLGGIGGQLCADGGVLCDLNGIGFVAVLERDDSGVRPHGVKAHRRGHVRYRSLVFVLFLTVSGFRPARENLRVVGERAGLQLPAAAVDVLGVAFFIVPESNRHTLAADEVAEIHTSTTISIIIIYF